MHAHSTSSVSHPGPFLKTVGGVRVDCELVSSGWQLSEWCEDRGPQHGGGGADPRAGEAGKEGTVGSFFCRVGCRGVELPTGRVGGMRFRFDSNSIPNKSPAIQELYLVVLGTQLFKATIVHLRCKYQNTNTRTCLQG